MTFKIAFRIKDSPKKFFYLDFTSTPDGEGDLKISEFETKADNPHTEKVLPAELINFKIC